MCGLRQLFTKCFIVALWLCLCWFVPAISAQSAEQVFDRNKVWDGPTTGPSAASQKRIIFIAEYLANGGVRGVATGVRQAVKAIGWRMDVLALSQTRENLEEFYDKLALVKPDGVIVGGSDAQTLKPLLKSLADEGVAIVGWHAGPVPGALDDVHVSYNVTTHPQEVAELAAKYVIYESQEQAKVVILTDSHYEIARMKSDAMANLIQACKSCELLKVEDVQMTGLIDRKDVEGARLHSLYEGGWTHILAINDLYFDYYIKYLSENNLSSEVKMVSAGDGSIHAFSRIEKGQMQVATVAEPLLLQGWQLVDELNRAFNGEAHSGYVSHPALMTRDNISLNENIFDPINGYRDAYQRIWFPK